MKNLTARFKMFLAIPVGFIVLAVIIGSIMGGLNMGIDFTGGTLLQIDMKKEFEVADVDAAIKVVGAQDATVSKSTDDAGKQTQAIVRMRALDDDKADDAMRANLVAEIAKTYPGAVAAQTERVGAVAGHDLVKNAILSLVIAAALMLVYVWIRFEFRQGAVAVLGILLDLAVMVSAMMLCRNFVQINSSFIAAILTVVGYDINNTIVVFDRVRENRKLMSSSVVSRAEIADRSVRDVLTRTINSSGTTLATIAMVYILGVPSIREFALPIIIGIASGLYTSVFLSAPLWAIWSDKSVAKKKKAQGSTRAKKKA